MLWDLKLAVHVRKHSNISQLKEFCMEEGSKNFSKPLSKTGG